LNSDAAEIQGVPEDLVHFIKSGSKFIVVGHKEPDGDCVGSQLALCSALVRLGKEAVACSSGPFKRPELRDYSGRFVAVPAEEEKSGARLIIVDCSGGDRIGSIDELLKGLPAAVIDHHAARSSSSSVPDIPVYVDPNSPSTTLLVLNVLNALNLELTSEEASLLLFGLCTDTGFFRHLNEKNAAAFEAAAKMVSAGASPKDIYRMLNAGESLNSRILLGHILSRTEPFFDGRLLLSCETLEDSGTFGIESRDSDKLNQLLLTVYGVEAVVIIRQEFADNCTVSLRSVDKINVAHIAASFGGGGHRNAAGFSIKGVIPDIKQLILESFTKIFICK
jgi:phosphoesterase RecJ-like protein